jgi:hypothetical protein
VPVNQAIEIRESATTFTVVERKPFELGSAARER